MSNKHRIWCGIIDRARSIACCLRGINIDYESQQGSSGRWLVLAALKHFVCVFCVCGFRPPFSAPRLVPTECMERLEATWKTNYITALFVSFSFLALHSPFLQGFVYSSIALDFPRIDEAAQNSWHQHATSCEISIRRHGRSLNCRSVRKREREREKKIHTVYVCTLGWDLHPQTRSITWTSFLLISRRVYMPMKRVWCRYSARLLKRKLNMTSSSPRAAEERLAAQHRQPSARYLKDCYWIPVKG